MGIEESIKCAYVESYNGIRKGDKKEEVELIKQMILNAKNIVVATNNPKKFKVVKDILLKILNKEKNKNIVISKIDIPTEVSDLTRMPALNKGLIAADTSNADIIIARGRFGVPGSGSMLLIMDNKGRILTGSLSPSSIIHKKSIEDTVKSELIDALKRIGITGNHW
ncbi:FeGP cofactor biosynthesis guanylyltransferase HcgB family protein [Methanothermococcus sp.]|uniref:FeGP cofactor biosynthesis guanylyltransferase HcgB family protein n=1 Tax=Methanothermococcus sp. TaxID=2614238 RepID=UPI0025E48AFF|nr:FeGP cofactor biosynthesis guanylyltransferase HcgB family protein [Methanothermococcus sp.]